MKVSIVAATYMSPIKAAALLIFTKSTRLKMDGDNLEAIEKRCMQDQEWMMGELTYMAQTIRSSWEFLDITFSIQDVSRACAQQITRTRFTPIDGDLYGSYAMQSQRVTDMSEATWHNPIVPLLEGDENTDHNDLFDRACLESMRRYQSMVAQGASLEDARGILPINLHCSLIAKYNLRILVDLVQARSSYRAQGEYNDLAAEMKRLTIELWPWTEVFFAPRDETAKQLVDDIRKSIDLMNLERTVMSDQEAHNLKIKLAKVDDLLQGKS